MRVIDGNKLMQLNEELAASLIAGDLKRADQLDEEMIRLVGTDGRVVINTVIAPPRLMYMYAFNRAMLQMNHGYVQEAALSMIDVMETLYFGGIQQEIFFVFDMLAEMRGMRDIFKNPFIVASDNLLMALLCTRQFPAISLSYLWKSYVQYKQLGLADLQDFVMSFIKIQYELVAVAYEKIDATGVNDFKEAASKIHAKCAVPSRKTVDEQTKSKSEQIITEPIKTEKSETQVDDVFKKETFRINTYDDEKRISKLYPSYDFRDSLLLKLFGSLDVNEEKQLPNIMQVLELVCYDEERYAAYYNNTCNMVYVSGELHEKDGKINMVVNPDGKYMFLPQGLVKNVYYRGQTKKYSPCYPSLYRKLSAKERLLERVKLCEFSILLQKHPCSHLFNRGIVNGLGNGTSEYHQLSIDDEALAQHYGIKTEYLDVTVDKWVAAFFACCDYVSPEDDRDRYDMHNKHDIGVFYIYKGEPDIRHDGCFRPIGIQPQSRPVLQAGFVKRMGRYKNFDTISASVPFKYDAECTRVIYNLFGKSFKIQPSEVIEQKAKKIVNEKHQFSEAAFIMAHQRYYKKLSDEKFNTMVQRYGLKSQSNPIVDFTTEELQQAFADRQIWEPYLWKMAYAQQIMMLPFDKD